MPSLSERGRRFSRVVAAPLALLAFAAPSDTVAQTLASQVNQLLATTSANGVTTFAAVGDYGSSGYGGSNINAAAAAGLAKQLNAQNPGFVLSLGDQLYGPSPRPNNAAGSGSSETAPLAVNNLNKASYQTAVMPLYGQYLPNSTYDPAGNSAAVKLFPVYADHDWYHETVQALLSIPGSPFTCASGATTTAAGSYCSPANGSPATNQPADTTNYVYTPPPTDPASVAFYTAALNDYSYYLNTYTNAIKNYNAANGTNLAVNFTWQQPIVFGKPGTPANSDSYEQFFNALFSQGQNGAANLVNSQTPSGTARWYDALQGNVHVFALSNDPNEIYQGGLQNEMANAVTANGTVIANPTLAQTPAFQNLTYTPTGAQALPAGVVAQGPWFLKALAASTATWNIAIMHQPVASSTAPEEGNGLVGTANSDGHLSTNYMQWFDQQTLQAASPGTNFPNVDLVLAGHVHAYERLYNDGVAYINNGAGGTFEPFADFCNQPQNPSSCSETYQVTPAFAGAGNSLNFSNNTMVGLTQFQAGSIYSFEQINVSPTFNYLEAQAWGSTDPGGAAGPVRWTLLDDYFIIKNGMINAAQASTATGITLSIPNGQTSGFGVINTQGQTVSLNATINGPGQLVVAGGGTLVLGMPLATVAQTLNSDASSQLTPLSGGVPTAGSETAFIYSPTPQNTYSGGTYVTGATTLSIAADALLGTGALTLDQGTLLTTQPIMSGRNIVLNSGNGTFSPLAPLTLTGAISGPGGLVMAGPGTLTLSGPLSYSGGTLVAGGTLNAVTPLPGAVGVTAAGTLNTALIQAGESVVNNGTLGGPVMIAGGGSLAGHGAVTGNLTVGGAILTTGTLGTTPISGALTFQAGATFQPGLGVSGVSDSLSVRGRATLAGGTVSPVLAQNFAGTFGTYTILTAAGGVSGQFGGVASPFNTGYYPYLGVGLGYGANAVTLSIGPANFALGAATANQAAVGGALNTLPASSPLVQAVAATPTLAAGQTTLTALSGDIYASSESEMQQRGAALRDAVGARIRQATAPEGSPQLAALEPVAAPLMPGSSATVWQQALGAWGRLDSTGNATGIDSTAAGYVIGIDAPLYDGWRAGLASGFDQDWFNSTGTAATAAMTGAHLAGYAGKRYGPLGIDAAVSNTWYSGSSTRTVALPGVTNSDTGGIGGTVTQVFGEANWDEPVPQILPGAVAQPFVGLAYAHVASSGFSETGGISALTVGAATLDDAYSTLGARGAVPFTLGAVPLKADGVVGWQHTFGATVPSVALAFANGAAPFTAQGVPLARDAALLGAGLRYDASPSLSFAIGYVGRIASRVQDNQVNGTLTLRF